MQSEAPKLSDWLILACSFAGAAFFAFLTVELVLQIISGHGSHAGNALRMVAAAISLLSGIFCATVGTLYWKSFDEAAGNSIV
jgi:hypothetical protein